jgi:glycosyltransferase involved in cell wall biosynthesis
MKVVFDNIIYSKEKQGGISNYWFEIGSRAIDNPEFDCYFYEEINAISNLCRQRLTIPSQNLITHPFKALILARLSALDVPFDNDFLYHSSFYRPLDKKKSFTEITTVHDFNHTFYSSFHRRIMHNYLKYRTIKRSDGIICVSHNTSNDLYKLLGPLANKEIAVIHNGVSDHYFQFDGVRKEDNSFLKSLKIGNSKFLLYVGGRTGYKNFDFVIELLKDLKDLKLIVVGNVFNKKEAKIIDADTMKRIIVTNHISNENLNILYNHAHCLVYPSSYEGFGIPVIEAMRAGCPVIALNKSSIPEIAAGSAFLLDDLSIIAFKNSINELSNSAVRNDLIAKGLEKSKIYSWDKCVQETFDFYKYVHSKKPKMV